MAENAVIGKTGRVTDRIDAGELGAVFIAVRGGTEEFYARAPEGVAIAAGQTVRVVGYAPPRTVDVEPLPAA